MSAVKYVNSNAEVVRRVQALGVNVTAAAGLQEVLRSNLGPKGTLKMLVSGAGDIRLTKDGAVLLHEMQIQHPSANLIARAATAQDDIAGDGTTSNILLIGEFMRQAERLLSEGLHPRVLVEGFDKAKEVSLEFLNEFKKKIDTTDREILIQVARSAIRTKLHEKMADHLADILVDAVLTIRRPNEPIDLHMVEIMIMQHKSDLDTQLVKGLVLDHGGRHPDMKKKAENAYILTANVSLEYEKSEVSSAFYFSSAEEKEKMALSERRIVDEKVRKLIEFKRKVIGESNKNFVIINQKGIDPASLDMLAKEGIIGLRRAKRRNMERIPLACGGNAVNSFDDLTEADLGYADNVYEHTLGEEKFTFVEGVKNPFSCTVLIKGPNLHVIAQIKDAVRDGLRAVKHAIEEGHVIPGAGSFEVACHKKLLEFSKSVSGRAKLGVQAFAEGLLVVPKTLALNSGYDAQDTLIKIQEEHEKGNPLGIDITTGEPIDPVALGILDNYLTKKQMISSSGVIASQLLLVDEIMKAGKNLKPSSS
eukprot:TRINITY_DN849_c0_g7_i1.p1 TRINITY_DN849_c0_g7~~TRINITY_DN849_c0_g7_i1.p1  ORF type:complete len:534 (+),score=146.20 TRINITY_DN849_c0_g7_i1:110-1711(+)